MKPPPLPYLVFFERTQRDGADYVNLLVRRTITVYLYSDRLDVALWGKLESLFDHDAIKYTKDYVFITSEKFWQTIYEFELIERT